MSVRNLCLVVTVLLCGCMDAVYVAPNTANTADLTISPPEGLSLGIASSRVVVVYAYDDPVNCRHAARIATFPKEKDASVAIPSGQEFPMLFSIFDRNTTCALVGGFTPEAGHRYAANVLEKPPSFWSRVKGAVLGGVTDGSCGVTFSERLADGTSRNVDYFIMGAVKTPGLDPPTCDRSARLDIAASMTDDRKR